MSIDQLRNLRIYELIVTVKNIMQLNNVSKRGVCFVSYSKSVIWL
jgi:hypothetical protein